MPEGKRTRAVHPRARLQAAAQLIGRAHTVADIGCDHGRLCMALLQSGQAAYAIAADISADSLEKARRLGDYVGLGPRLETRLGDGLSVLQPGEADVVVLCGMGGQLIARLLEQARPPLRGAAMAVCQPMRGVEELRRYLFRQGYRIREEKVVLEQGRYYQLFSVEPGREDPQPPGWPEGCFLAGPKALGEPMFEGMLRHMLAQCDLRLRTAAGTRGERVLLEKQAALQALLKLHHEGGTQHAIAGIDGHTGAAGAPGAGGGMGQPRAAD